MHLCCAVPALFPAAKASAGHPPPSSCRRTHTPLTLKPPSQCSCADVQVRLDSMRIRPVPFLGTDTPMYDLLRLFQVWRLLPLMHSAARFLCRHTCDWYGCLSGITLSRLIRSSIPEGQ